MDEDIKICDNCNREIPAVNFTIHSVHCIRNIRMCPVCKEPLPLTELEEHSEKLHKLLPCEKCGEMVCGTDMEDHIRDSCDYTIQTCRWCELELSRRDLPMHEGYCGARTEECAQCGEFVMHKYRQLHLESNHGFVRLDDDPVPPAMQQRPTAARGYDIFNRPANRLPRLLDPQPEEDQHAPLPDIADLFGNPFELFSDRYQYIEHEDGGAARDLGPGDDGSNRNVQRRRNINLNVLPRNNNGHDYVLGVNVNNLWSLPRGAIKKRRAPIPPTANPPVSETDDQAQPRAAPVGEAYSLFPPSTSANTPVSGGSNAGPFVAPVPGPCVVQNDRPRNHRNTTTNEFAGGSEKNRRDLRLFSDAIIRGGGGVEMEGAQAPANNEHEDFKNVKPMTPAEFMNRFRELQLEQQAEEDQPGRNPPEVDSFTVIKSNLKHLRRGLKEVTATYNNNNNVGNERGNPPPENIMADRAAESDDSDYNSEAGGGDEAAGHVAAGGGMQAGGDVAAGGDIAAGGDVAAGGGDVAAGGDEATGYAELMDVKLPCEFCGESVLALDLVEHETGCRPDLAQLHPEPPREPAYDDIYDEQLYDQREERSRRDSKRRRPQN